MRPFTRRGLSRIRGSPTCGAPTRSSIGTRYSLASGSSSSRVGATLPVLQPRQGALRDAGLLGGLGQGQAALLPNLAQPRPDQLERCEIAAVVASGFWSGRVAT